MGGPKAQAECREFNGFGPKNIFAVAEAALDALPGIPGLRTRL